jgi:hypothetical protein
MQSIDGFRAWNDPRMRLREIVFDCHNPAALATFWAAIMDDFDVRPYDDAEIARLSALGLTPETDPNVIVDGPGLKLCFQKTDPVPTTKNKVHLDISVSDRAKEVARVVSLGATIVESFDGSTWLRDPEGNDFCLTDLQ